MWNPNGIMEDVTLKVYTHILNLWGDEELLAVTMDYQKGWVEWGGTGVGYQRLEKGHDGCRVNEMWMEQRTTEHQHNKA